MMQTHHSYKQKLHQWLLLMPLLMLMACSSSDPDISGEEPALSTIPISFQATSKWDADKQSRVTENGNSVSFEKDDAIGVFAYYRPNKDWTNTQEFMNNQMVIYDGNTWSYSPVKYWPNKGDIVFYAYSSPNTVPATIEKENHSPKVTWKNIGDYEIMWASPKTINCPTENEVQEQPSFTFIHKLMRIGVKLLKGDLFTDDEKVTKLTIEGADANNVMENILTLDLATGESDYSLENSSDNPKYEIVENGSTISVENTELTKKIFIKPTTKIKLSLSTSKRTFEEQIITLQNPLPGSSYIFNITIDGEGFYVTITNADNWNDVNLDDQVIGE